MKIVFSVACHIVFAANEMAKFMEQVGVWCSGLVVQVDGISIQAAYFFSELVVQRAVVPQVAGSKFVGLNRDNIFQMYCTQRYKLFDFRSV